MAEQGKINVLLVDDEPHVRQLVKAVLMTIHCDTVEAADGSQAVAAYQSHRPDAVLLDINMPIKDGRATLREIMAFDPDAVVIMLTSVSDAETIRDCIEAGAVHYIRKDTPPLEMRKIIKETFDEYLGH